MKRFIWPAMAVALLIALAVGTLDQSRSVTPAERTAALADQIRCPTCAGLSVDDSETPLAKSSYEEIERRVAAGESDAAIKAYFVSRYGNEALLSPPTNGFSGLVWALPIGLGVVLAAGTYLTVMRWRRRPEAAFSPSVQNDRKGPSNSTLDGKRNGRRRSLALAAVVVAVAGGGIFVSTNDRLTGDSSTGDIAADSNSLLRRAREQAGNGRADQAVKTYDQVLALDANNVEALTYRGWLVRLAGLPNEGLKTIERAIVLDPTYPDARFFRGIILLRDRQQPAAAIPEFELFLANNPPQQLVPLVQSALADAKAQAAKSGSGNPPV